MSTTDKIGIEGAVGEHAYEQIEDEGGFEIIDEVAERESSLRPSVKHEIQAKIDYADEWERDGRLFGQTLEAQERMEAYEWEVERTRVRWDRRQESDREARCRCAVTEVGREQRYEFAERAASVDPRLDPERADPRELLSQQQLGLVNREAKRIGSKLEGWTSAAVSRRLAEQVVDGQDLTSSVLAVFDELRMAPGQVIPVGLVGEVSRREVDIEGTITHLWKPSHPKIAQVGLLEDETGRIKFTAWKASGVDVVREAERVRMRSVAKNWYNGRVSVALTGRSRIETDR